MRHALVSTQYRPDVVAQSLAGLRSKTIALNLLPHADSPKALSLSNMGDSGHYFYLELLQFLEREISQAGFDLTLPSHASDDSTEFVRTLRLRRVAGALMIATHPSDRITSALIASGIPTVFIDGIGQGPQATYVKSDHVAAAELAVHHLLGLGHRRIAIVDGPVATLSGDERLLGYQRALGAGGVPVRPELICETTFGTADAFRATVALLERTRDFTAVVAGSDLMAMGVIRALRERGLRVPSDVSVVGFDDVDLCEYLDPPLTTVRQDRPALASGAVRLLLAMVVGQTGCAPLIVPSELVVRQSTAPPPGRR